MAASTVITGISSMATRQVLAELAADYERASGVKLAIESVGGVDAAKRVAPAEAFDVVMLAADAIDKLIAAGHVAPGRVDLVRSPVAIAVQAGAPRPVIESEEAVKQAVLAAPSISYSPAPSGTHLVKLFEALGHCRRDQGKLVQAPPGVPVGTLVARGEVSLGFQQLSELMHLDGVDVVGLLPEAIAFITTFSAAIGAHTAQADAVRAMLAYLTSPDAAAAKRRHGMEPA